MEIDTISCLQMTGSGCQLNKSAGATAAQSQSKFILPSLIPRNEHNDEHPNVVPRYKVNHMCGAPLSDYFQTAWNGCETRNNWTVTRSHDAYLMCTSPPKTPSFHLPINNSKNINSIQLLVQLENDTNSCIKLNVVQVQLTLACIHEFLRFFLFGAVKCESETNFNTTRNSQKNV